MVSSSARAHHQLYALHSNPIIFFLTLIGLITFYATLLILYATYNFGGKDDPHL